MTMFFPSFNIVFLPAEESISSQNSNIVNLFSMLKKDDPKKQLVYYQVRSFPPCTVLVVTYPNMFNKAGIGTYTIPQIAKPMMAKLHKVLDSMVGIHLDAHVMGKYVPLRHHFFH